MKSYDPNRHNITFGAVMIGAGKGLGDDVFLEHAREADKWEDDVGVDGEVTRSKINDNRATITITVMQSSDLNDQLSAHYNLDANVPGGVGGVPFLMQDMNGRTVLFAEEAWLARAPDQKRARKVGTVQWKIRCASLVESHGGNA